MTTAVFQASDLAGAKRREFLGAARKGGALLRDTDGFALTMVPLSQLEAITEVARTAVAALLAAAAEVDRAVKGMATDDPWVLLLRIGLLLAREASERVSTSCTVMPSTPASRRPSTRPTCPAPTIFSVSVMLA